MLKKRCSNVTDVGRRHECKSMWLDHFGKCLFMKSTFDISNHTAITSLVFPLLVELSLGLVVGMVGTALAAGISDAAGGAFALSHHVFGLLFMVFRLVGAGVSVVITQNLGAGHRAEADRVARAALASGTWMGGGGSHAGLVVRTPDAADAQCAR